MKNKKNSGDDRIVFGIVGSGWRAECFLQAASLIPDRFRVSALVSRRKEKREELHKRWDVPVYESIDEMLKHDQSDFIVTAVSKSVGAGMIKELSARGIPVLAETPPAPDLDSLIDLYRTTGPGARIQVAEQYHLQPMHTARLHLIESGKLGEVGFVHVSISHGYHGISLMRKYLGIGFENAVIQADSWELPVIEGPGRQGLPEVEGVREYPHVIATLKFRNSGGSDRGEKIGVYDFEQNQHRSWIRSQRILIRGDRGEINNTSVKYLQDYLTPVSYEFIRQQAGEFENLEGFYLKGITGGDSYLYANPYPGSRLSDEEIAIATSLERMSRYLTEGEQFYSLADACQDQYLALMIDEAIRFGKSVNTESQCWAE